MNQEQNEIEASRRFRWGPNERQTTSLQDYQYIADFSLICKPTELSSSLFQLPAVLVARGFREAIVRKRPYTVEK